MAYQGHSKVLCMCKMCLNACLLFSPLNEHNKTNEKVEITSFSNNFLLKELINTLDFSHGDSHPCAQSTINQRYFKKSLSSEFILTSDN